VLDVRNWSRRMNRLSMCEKPLLDAIVMKDGQGNRSLANPAIANESDWSGVLCETKCLLDQVVASKKEPR